MSAVKEEKTEMFPPINPVATTDTPRAPKNNHEEPFTVVVRMRPRNTREQGTGTVVRLAPPKLVIFDPKDESEDLWGKKEKHHNFLNGVQRARNLKYAFDHVFAGSATNEDVYEKTAKQLVDTVLNGFNATVFAYGATGSGKTHSMIGTKSDPGVMVRTLHDLFDQMGKLKATHKYRLEMSYLEVYNETIRDLLVAVPDAKNEYKRSEPLPLREDEHGHTSAVNLTSHFPEDPAEIFSLLAKGNANRSQAPTDRNAESSRSHAVLQVQIKERDASRGLVGAVQAGKLSLIDLAGSERACVSNNRGNTQIEGANINKSLLALGNCINALSSQKKGAYVPYRDSKLTRLLKDSLGGNCKTVMLAAISPSQLCFEDTNNTLKYANRAKNIKTSLFKNLLEVKYSVAQYTKIIEELTQQVDYFKAAKMAEEDSPMGGGNKDWSLDSTVFTSAVITDTSKIHKHVKAWSKHVNTVTKRQEEVLSLTLQQSALHGDLATVTNHIRVHEQLAQQYSVLQDSSALEELRNREAEITTELEAVEAKILKIGNASTKQSTKLDSILKKNDTGLLIDGQIKNVRLEQIVWKDAQCSLAEATASLNQREARHHAEQAREVRSLCQTQTRMMAAMMDVINSQQLALQRNNIHTPELRESYADVWKMSQQFNVPYPSELQLSFPLEEPTVTKQDKLFSPTGKIPGSQRKLNRAEKENAKTLGSPRMLFTSPSRLPVPVNTTPTLPHHRRSEFIFASPAPKNSGDYDEEVVNISQEFSNSATKQAKVRVGPWSTFFEPQISPPSNLKSGVKSPGFSSPTFNASSSRKPIRMSTAPSNRKVNKRQVAGMRTLEVQLSKLTKETDWSQQEWKGKDLTGELEKALSPLKENASPIRRPASSHQTRKELPRRLPVPVNPYLAKIPQDEKPTLSVVGNGRKVMKENQSLPVLKKPNSKFGEHIRKPTKPQGNRGSLAMGIYGQALSKKSKHERKFGRQQNRNLS